MNELEELRNPTPPPPPKLLMLLVIVLALLALGVIFAGMEGHA